MLEKLEDIKHAFYINLESRVDRKIYVENELQKLGVKAERFNAICLSNGAIGCSMSHLKCLEIAKEKNWDHLLIVEDDITFTNPSLFKYNLNKFLCYKDDWDVLLFGGNVIPPFQREHNWYVQVFSCQTTIGYLVKSHYFDTLIQNYKESIQLLMKNPANKFEFAIDRYWFKLQEKDKWFLITPLTVTQKENDFSDIECRKTNYSNLMLDLEKSWLKKN